jgi:hypothetical protein
MEMKEEKKKSRLGLELLLAGVIAVGTTGCIEPYGVGFAFRTPPVHYQVNQNKKNCHGHGYKNHCHPHNGSHSHGGYHHGHKYNGHKHGSHHGHKHGHKHGHGHKNRIRIRW